MVQVAERVRVLIVDDHVAMAEGMALVLGLRPGLEVVGVARRADEAVDRAAALQPDVVLLDIHLPNVSGLEVGPDLLEVAPAARLIYLSAYVNPEYVLRALALGARGYLIKQASSQEIGEAVEQVAQGRAAFSPAARRFAAAIGLGPVDGEAEDALSPREREVVLLRASGASITDVAAELGIGARTVRHHWDRAIERLGLQAMPLQLFAAWDEGR